MRSDQICSPEVPNGSVRGLRMPSKLSPDDESGVVRTSEQVASAIPKRHAHCVSLISVFSMVAITFIVLVGGKVGFTLADTSVHTSVYAIVHLASIANDPIASDRVKLGRRAVQWMGVVLARAIMQFTFFSTFDERTTFQTWQWVPISMSLIWYCVDIFVIGGSMMHVHRDRRPAIWRWWVFACVSGFCMEVGKSTPHRLIGTLGALSFVFAAIVALPYIIMFKDRDASREDTKRGYVLIAGACIGYAVNFMLKIATAPFPASVSQFETIIKSIVQMITSFFALRLMIPVMKNAFGNDTRKLWSFIIPACVIALEIGQVAIFLGSSVTEWQFWALTGLHEVNSFMRNTGVYLSLFVRIRKVAGQPVSERELQTMEERRSILAPCDVRFQIVCCAPQADLTCDVCNEPNPKPELC